MMLGISKRLKKEGLESILDNLETSLTELGIKHTDIGTDWQGIRYCYLHDPDGNQIELHE